MDAAEIARIAVSLLEPGGVSKIAGLVEQLLILINHLTKDDPAKDAKARRVIAIAFQDLIKEVANAQDASDIALRFAKLLDES